jgi:hypothetical protein
MPAPEMHMSSVMDIHVCSPQGLPKTSRARPRLIPVLTLSVVAAEVVPLLDRDLLDAQPGFVPLWVRCLQDGALPAAALQGIAMLPVASARSSMPSCYHKAGSDGSSAAATAVIVYTCGTFRSNSGFRRRNVRLTRAAPATGCGCAMAMRGTSCFQASWHGGLRP